jgi:hypothetical protein
MRREKKYMKTFSEMYLPAEQLTIDYLFRMIQSIIKEKKKIPFHDSDKSTKEEFLEYFTIADSMISFHRHGGTKNRRSITGKQLKDAIKYALRTDEELTRKGFTKRYGATNFLGLSLYLFVNLVADEITKHKIVEEEVSHQSFGKGLISKIELEKDYFWFKYGEDCKMLSMNHFSLLEEDEQKIINKITLQ